MMNYWSAFYFIDRGDTEKGTPDIFFKYFKQWKDEKGAYPPPAMVSSRIKFQNRTNSYQSK